MSHTFRACGITNFEEFIDNVTIQTISIAKKSTGVPSLGLIKYFLQFSSVIDDKQPFVWRTFAKISSFCLTNQNIDTPTSKYQSTVFKRYVWLVWFLAAFCCMGAATEKLPRCMLDQSGGACGTCANLACSAPSH